MRRFKIHITLLFLGILNGCQLYSQQYNIRTYADPQEIGQSQIYALFEDSRSYIWLGTQGGGLTRFDGLAFENYTKEDGLPDNYIRCLFEDPQGWLWIGTDRGLCYFDGLTFHILSKTLQVNSFASSKDSTLWIAADQGLFTVNDTSLSQFGKQSDLDGALLRACIVDQKDQIWVGGREGLWKIKDRQLKYFGEEDGLTNIDIHALVEDQKGQIWIATANDGINIYHQNEFSRFEQSDIIEESGVNNCLFVDRSGNIWIGTSRNGAFSWNPRDRLLTALGTNEGLESPSVETVIEDRWGNIWLGTSGGGVSCYSGRQFLHYNLKNGLLDEHVYSVHKENSEKVWIGTANGASLLERGQFQHFNASNGFLDSKVKAILVDDVDRLWLGTEGKGLSYRDTSDFQQIRSWDGLGGDQVLDIVQDSAGQIWVAMADAGITRLSPDLRDTLQQQFLFERHNRQKGIPDTYVYQLLIDRQHRIWWAGRTKGLGYIEGDSIVTIGKAQGLKDTEIRSIAEDRYGNIWGGLRRGGIFRMEIDEEGYAFDYFGKADGLSSENIYLLAFDEANNLWLGNEKGLDRIRFDAAQNIIEVDHYGTAEGFQGGETCTNSVADDGIGGLWFGSLQGLTRYIPGTTQKNEQAPILDITEVQLFYEPLEQTPYGAYAETWGGIKSGLVLPHDQNHLGFHFIGLNHNNPAAVDYQWMLKGQENSWSPRRKERTARYSNLAPGKYRFMLRAYNEDGVVNEKVLVQEFEILPPFWSTWWFRLAALLVVILGIYSFFRSRINQVKRKAKRERAKLEMEKNLLELEQKALQLQMNPHFIFNALNSIQGLITQQDHKTARYQLAKFSKLMRATLENSRSPKITLEQEVDTLFNYLALERFSRDNRFDFDIKVAENLEQEATLIPPMIIQPFVENAIKHGMADEVEEGRISIHFSILGQFLKCVVEDNGVGRERAKTLKSQQEEQHRSMALEVTEERLQLLGNERSMEIIDLVSKEGKAEGTRVVLKLPLDME